MEQKRTLSIGITVNLGNYENLHLEVSDAVETKEDAAGLRRFLADVLDDFAANNATAKHAIDQYKERILDDDESSDFARAGDSREEDYPDPVILFDEPDASDVPDVLEVSETLVIPAPVVEPVSVSIPIPPSAAAVEEPEPEPETEPEIPLVSLTETESENETETPVPETFDPVKYETESEPVLLSDAEKEITDTINAIENKPETVAPPKPEPEAKPDAKTKPPAPQTPAGEVFTCEKCGAPINKVQAQVSKLFSGKNLCQDCFNGTKK